jgi:hypothetical protein
MSTENYAKLHAAEGLGTPTVAGDKFPSDKKTTTPSAHLYSSPKARTMKMEELYPTSDSDPEIENTQQSRQQLDDLEMHKPAHPLKSLKSPPQTTDLTDIEGQLSSEDDVQFVKQHTRKLKKCTTYRPPSTLPEGLMDADDAIVDNVRTVFAEDPTRSPPLTITEEEVQHLNRNHFLTTRMLDYLTQFAIPKDIVPDNVLIGTSNSFRFFEIQNEKDIDSPDPVDARRARVLRRQQRS